MAVVLHKDMLAAHCHAPRVNNKSLVLEDPGGGAAFQAKINDVVLGSDQVVLWDNTNKRLFTSGVTQSELGRLDGAIPGGVLASKVVIPDASKDLDAITGSRIRNLALDGTLLVEGVTTLNANVNIVGVGNDLSVGGDVSVGEDFSVTGFVVSNLTLHNYNYRLRGFRGGNYRDMIYHSDSYDMIYLGNTTDDIFCQSKIYMGGTVGAPVDPVWHGGNDGAGSGLDADLLDGQEGAYYRQSDANNFINQLADSKLADGISYHKVRGHASRAETHDPAAGPDLYIEHDDIALHLFTREIQIAEYITGFTYFNIIGDTDYSFSTIRYMRFVGMRIRRTGSTWFEDSQDYIYQWTSGGFQTIWSGGDVTASWFFSTDPSILIQADNPGSQNYFGLVGTIWIYGS